MTEQLIDFFPGVSAMANVHPLLVHFPIALYLGFLTADFLSLFVRSDSLRHAATWMLYFGTLGAVAAVMAGFHAADTVEHGEDVHALMEQHETYGFVVLGLGLLLSIWRLIAGARLSGLGRWVHLGLALVMVSAMALGTDLGGLMVYGHAVAVQTSCECPPAELAPVLERQPLSDPAEQAPTVELPLQQHPHPHRHRHSHGSHAHKH